MGPRPQRIPLSYRKSSQMFTGISRYREETFVEQLKWIEGYSGQTTDELLALEGQFRTDSLVVAFHQALDQKSVRIAPEPLSEEENVVLAIQALDCEVNNGGYSLVFVNSSKELTPALVDALRRIGCVEKAALTQQAIAALGINGPITVDAIDRVMAVHDDERDAKLLEYDQRYYQITEDVAGSLFAFIKRNKRRIVLCP